MHSQLDWRHLGDAGNVEKSRWDVRVVGYMKWDTGKERRTNRNPLGILFRVCVWGEPNLKSKRVKERVNPH